MLSKVLALMIVILALIAYLFPGWAITCIFLQIIAWCFGFTFDFKIATGIWLTILFVKTFLGTSHNT